MSRPVFLKPAFLKPVSAALAVICAGALAGAAHAADAKTPDWPCVQRRVTELSAGQVWDGPPIDQAEAGEAAEKITALLPLLTSRRVPIAEVEAGIKQFAESQPADKRDGALTALFAALFQSVNAERKTIVLGIEKFNRRQRELAATLEEKGRKLADLEAKASSSEAAAKELAQFQEQYDWDTRIFKERNDNLPVACEIPVIIDERLFAIARSIRGEMKG